MRIAEKTKPKKGLPADKPADVAKRGEMLDSAMTVPEGGKPDANADHVRSMADTLMRHNGGQASDAIGMAKALLDPGAKFSKKEAEGGAKYKLKGGKEFFVPDEVIERATEHRIMAQSAGDVPIGQSRAADDPLAAKPGFMEGAAEAWNGGAQPRQAIPVGPGKQPPTVASTGGPTPMFGLPRSQALEDVPPEWVPGRGLGER
jgi:hypothetical protein